MNSRRVAVLGAGPIGLEAAVYAHACGYQVTVYEADRVGGESGEPSIADMTRAAIAVKLYGADLYQLRQYAGLIKTEMEKVDGLVDLFVDQQTDVPQVRITANRERMALYGLRPMDIDELIDVYEKARRRARKR